MLSSGTHVQFSPKEGYGLYYPEIFLGKQVSLSAITSAWNLAASPLLGV